MDYTLYSNYILLTGNRFITPGGSDLLCSPLRGGSYVVPFMIVADL